MADKTLVIVESPAKAKKIAGYLGPDYTVLASVGHIRDLASKVSEMPAELRNIVVTRYVHGAETNMWRRRAEPLGRPTSSPL